MALKIIEEEGLGKKGKQWIEELSSEPRVSIYHNFLSKEECDYLINLAKPQMVRSKVEDGITGQAIYSSARTSSGVFLKRGQDKVFREIEKRIAAFTSIPVEHGECLHLLHYEVGQKFETHHDYLTNKINTENGGQRMATLLTYLSDVEEGGETVFPKNGLSVKPKMEMHCFSGS